MRLNFHHSMNDFIQHHSSMLLEEGTKTHLVLGREIQESPIFFIVTLLS